MDGLRVKLESIADQAIVCDRKCSDVHSDLEAGIPPRCAYYDDIDRRGGAGIVIVGQNPGRAKPAEREYYRACDQLDYATLREYWAAHLVRAEKPANYYYRRLRAFADALGLHGPIWWTEMAKCETRTGIGTIGTQTLRRCTTEFLDAELRAIPKDWPVIAVSKPVFQALAYMAPERAVVGCPHPTGAGPLFAAVLRDVKERGAPFERATECLHQRDAVWLTKTR